MFGNLINLKNVDHLVDNQSTAGGADGVPLLSRGFCMKGGGVLFTMPSSALGQLFAPSRPETLRADDSEKPPALSEEESYVKINDRVVAVDDP